MPMLPQQFVDQVQQATDIVDLIGQYVSIRKRGRDHVGLCPFHQEKTPSFTVSASKQIFKCFGCGAGGGVFQFLMQQIKCTFPEAVRLLAEQAGIPMPDLRGERSAGGVDRGRLVRLMRLATEFYQQQLRSPAGAAALAYAHDRQLTDESIERFELGYAPNSWDAAGRAARSAGFGEEELVAAGLTVRREQGGSYDRFRNRLMFPIIDTAGSVIAFGGRALDAAERAKYLNSPETILFDKSSNLYGLSWARKAITDSSQAVVVEGYLDALMPAQVGVANVVATLGTALTPRHVRRLSRLAGDVVVMFDADTAGTTAARRSLELFIAQQVNVRVAAVPDGKDPCDYVIAAGATAFRQLVDQAPDALAYAWQQRSAEYAAGGTLVQKRRAAEEFLRLVVNSSAYGAIDSVRQGLLVNQMGQLMGMSAEELSGQVRRLVRQIPTASAASPGEPLPGGLAAVRRRILEVLIVEPELFDQAARHVAAEDFVADSILSGVAGEVWRLGGEGELSLESLLRVEAGPEWGRLVTDLAVAGERRGNYAATLAGDVEMMERRHHRRELDQLRRIGDDSSLRELTERLKKPDPRRRPW